MAAPYTLFRRGAYFYVQFRDASGKRLGPRSTGKKLKREAEAWAAEQFRKNAYTQPRGRLTFARYAESWWKPKECAYIRRRRAEGRTLSEGYVAACRGLLENHILPYFRDVRLDKISRGQIEDWKVKLFEESGRAAETVNHALMVLKIMLREAYRRETIPGNPADLVSGVSGPKKVRTALTLEHARLVFENRSRWPDLRHFALNLLGFTTGARLGELQALKWRNAAHDHITIVEAWDRRLKEYKAPKWDSKRVVPIPRYTQAVLREWRHISPFAEETDLVFPSIHGDRPVNPHEVNRVLRHVVKDVGLDTDFTFHGWRHTYVTLLRTTVDDTKLRMLTRHRSEELVDRYTHLDVDRFKDVTAAQDEWLPEAVKED